MHAVVDQRDRSPVRHSGGKGRDEGVVSNSTMARARGAGMVGWALRRCRCHGGKFVSLAIMAWRAGPDGRGGHGATRSTTPVLRNGKSDRAWAKEDPRGAKQCKQMGRRRRAAIRPGHD